MPELPEVELTRRNLERWAKGRTIEGVLVEANCPGDDSGASLFSLQGRSFLEILRKGKLLLASLSSGMGLLLHLGMTGKLLHRPQGAPEAPFVRAVFRLSDGARLLFCDQRRLGTIKAGD